MRGLDVDDTLSKWLFPMKDDVVKLKCYQSVLELFCKYQNEKYVTVMIEQIKMLQTQLMFEEINLTGDSNYIINLNKVIFEICKPTNDLSGRIFEILWNNGLITSEIYKSVPFALSSVFGSGDDEATIFFMNFFSEYLHIPTENNKTLINVIFIHCCAKGKLPIVKYIIFSYSVNIDLGYRTAHQNHHFDI